MEEENRGKKEFVCIAKVTGRYELQVNKRNNTSNERW